MTDGRHAALRMVVCKVLDKVLGDEKVRASAEFRASMIVGESVVAQLPDGIRVGKVTYTAGAKRVRVDERKLEAWVREHRPGELVEYVRPSFVEWCKDQVKREGVAFDTQSGEIIPGVELVEGDPHPTVTGVADEQIAAVVRALRSGAVPTLTLEPADDVPEV